ncbi:MAG: ABC transporter ATP-binding protein [Gemmatimonadota bacterium]
MLRRLLPFLRPHRWRLVQTLLSNFGAAALDVFSFTLLIPFLDVLFGIESTGRLSSIQNPLLGALFDSGDRIGSLRNIILVILLAVLLKNVLVWLSGQSGAALQEYVTRDLRNAVYDHLQRLPLSFFGRTRVGQAIARVLTDTQQTKLVLTEAITRSIQSGAMVTFAVISMLLTSVRLTLLALAIAPLLIFLLQPILRKLRAGHRHLAGEYGDLTSVVQETVNGIRLVKAFGAEEYESGRFREASDRYARGMKRVSRLALLAQPLTETAATGVAMLILWLGAREVLAGGAMTGSELIYFLSIVMRVLQPLKQLSQVRAVAQSSFAAADRLFEVIDRDTEAMTDRGTRRPPTLSEGMTFEGVSFAYDSEPVLENISFAAARGDVIAIVGPSGAGKSTLVDLIPRFHEPTAGRILFDGIDARDVALPALRSLIGVVSQDTVIFNDTVRNNIAYGSAARFTEREIEQAARLANAHEFIAALPAGYDTPLGERGTRLSGGQRQRIAIARALLADPTILIFDEATSALDVESERLVQGAIERLLAGRTVFVIAHRLSTIHHATRILVLDRGRLVESGTHHSLLEQNGVYRRLHDLQFSSRSPADPLPVVAG